jgi:hypothetical protein
VVFGGRFAEVNELPDLPAKLGEIAVLPRGKVAVSAHIYIVSRYKWFREYGRNHRLCGG